MMPFALTARLSLTPLALPLAALLTLGAYGCSGKIIDPNAGSSQDGLAMGSPENTGNGAWLQIQACPSTQDSDAIEVTGLSISGDTLSLDYSHGGGCAEHSYALCYGQQWDESYPVQIPLRLIHDAHGDNCEALLQGQLEFSLQPLADAYEQAYQSDGGAARLSLEQWSELYSFGSVANLPSWEEIAASVDELNTCNTVEDCKGISDGFCSVYYVNKDADTTQLEADIQARADAEKDENYGCLALCRCGLLSCEAGMCATSEGDCMNAPADSTMICL